LGLEAIPVEDTVCHYIDSEMNSNSVQTYHRMYFFHFFSGIIPQHFHQKAWTHNITKIQVFLDMALCWLVNSY